MMFSIIEAIRWKGWASRDNYSLEVVVRERAVRGWLVSALLMVDRRQCKAYTTAETETSEGLVVAELQALSWLRADLEKRGIVPPMPSAPNPDPKEE